MLEVRRREKVEILRLVTKMKDDILLEICDDTLCNLLIIDKRYPKIRLEGENMWLMNPCDRSWRFWLHTLKNLEYLIDGYIVFEDIKYLDKALDIIWDWKKHNFPKSSSDMAWHDHSTALRLIILCKVYEHWRGEMWDDKTYDEFCELITAHCLKLTDSSFYMEKHNHGMDQDIALLTASVVFFQIPESSFWRELALERLEKQLRHLFKSDGSYTEHSPHYVYMLANRLFKVLSFIKINNIESNSDLELILNKAMKYLSYILQPDGRFPSIGDSIMLTIDPKQLTDPTGENLNEVEYISSNGTYGKCPGGIDAIFPEGGYAILRNKWHFDQDTVQSVFYSSFHSRVHKHHDDLSITLFGHGQPLLVDSGKYNYVYDSPERQYVVSTKAHNTVVVDDESTDISRNNIGKSGLTGYYLDENFSLISGTHCLYPGVIHQRLLLYLKPHDFIIVDNLQGYKEHRFEQNFHFDPSVSCQYRDNTIIGYKGEKPVISLSQIYKNKDISVNLINGQKEPLLGWVSPSYAKLEPTFCASSLQTGEEAQFITHVSLRPSNPLHIGSSWEDDTININWKSNNLKIIISTNRIHLALNEQFLDMNYINQPKLKEAIKEQGNHEYREKYRSERMRRLRYHKELEDIKKKIQM